MVKIILVFLLFVLVVSNAQKIYSNRIIGGNNAYDGQFPYQVSICRKGEHVCGGSIISRSHVLTAGHCFGYWSPGSLSCYTAKDYQIRAGSTDRLTGGVLNSVSQIIVHENYNNYLNDIALLKLKEPLIFTKNIQPIQLAWYREPPKDSAVIITGWGLTENYGDTAQILQQNTLTVLPHKDCQEIKADAVSMLCLSHERGNGACNYDSGGAAVWNGELVGVANFIYAGCGSNFPDAYANVYYHLNWIKSHADL